MTVSDALEQTASLYAELVAAYKRPPTVGEGDITAYAFAQDIGATVDVARQILDAEVRAGKLVKVARISANNRPMWAYRTRDETGLK